VDLRGWEGDSTVWRGSVPILDLLATTRREELIKIGAQAF